MKNEHLIILKTLGKDESRFITSVNEAELYFVKILEENNYTVKEMAKFFGIEFNGVEWSVVESRKYVLCGEFNHNHMRFTRFLLAMYYFGFGKTAKKIFEAVSAEATEKTSVGFWN